MNKKTIYILITILSILLIVGIILIAFSIGNSNVKYKEKVVYKEAKVKTASDINKYENIVFLGDSITDFYPIDDIFVDLSIINSGVSGYKTQDILDNMNDMVYKYNPTSVYLLIGTNDLLGDDEEEVENVKEKTKEIVDEIHKNRKKTNIYIESIYPINRRLNLSSVKERYNEEIMEVNDYLKEYCEEKSYLTYIDVYKYLIDGDGNFSKIYTEDGLHPNELGYARISQVLLPYIYSIN